MQINCEFSLLYFLKVTPTMMLCLPRIALLATLLLNTVASLDNIFLDQKGLVRLVNLRRRALSKVNGGSIMYELVWDEKLAKKSQAAEMKHTDEYRYSSVPGYTDASHQLFQAFKKLVKADQQTTDTVFRVFPYDVEFFLPGHKKIGCSPRKEYGTSFVLCFLGPDVKHSSLTFVESDCDDGFHDNDGLCSVGSEGKSESVNGSSISELPIVLVICVLFYIF
ncbi:unnamed protein product [Caenorhabditis brenneri]